MCIYIHETRDSGMILSHLSHPGFFFDLRLHDKPGYANAPGNPRLQVYFREDRSAWRMFFINMELHGMKHLYSPQNGTQPPPKKKTLRVWSECDWNFGHCCVAFMFPFLSCCNQPFCLPVALKHQSRKSPPPSPWIPIFIPPEFPSKSHFFCSLPRSHPNHLGA